MRTWRVGSFSMGAALVFLGIFLLLSQVFDWDPAIAMVSWWPILFIILGVEILVFLAIGKNDKQYVKYDFISIIFISVIGTFGLGMAMLNTVGLLDVAHDVVSAEELTENLPKYEETLSDDIKRVVVETGPYELNIEATPANKAVLFGTYTANGLKQSSVKEISDYALIEKQADTLYIKIKRLPTSKIFSNHGWMEATLLIPDTKQVEVKARGNDLQVETRKLQADWSISKAGTITFNVKEDANISIQATDIQYLDEDSWNIKKNDDEYADYVSGSYKIGNGEQIIQVHDSYKVQIEK
nr:hypothetical protein [Paenibacillus bovis]